MALAIPTLLEETFTQGDGSKGQNIKEAFSFALDKVDNLYSWDPSSNQFKLSFREKGVAYNETESSTQLAEVVFKTCGKDTDFKLLLDATPTTKWGLNFVGVVRVTHSTGEKRSLYLPGTRTYDPAGITGDPHASERIGPSCSRTQTAITLSQLVAAANGAVSEQVNEVQEACRPLIVRYHGRVALFDWMFLQIQETIFEKREVTPYPEYLKGLMRAGSLRLDEKRDHTRAYILSYNEGKARPPVQYYRKVSAKDKVGDILSSKDLEEFNKLIQ